MHRNPLSESQIEDVFGPSDKASGRSPRSRMARGLKRQAAMKIESLEAREVPAIDATIAASSLATATGNTATIGEVVRVRAVVALPSDGFATEPSSYNVTSTLPSGLKYLDGTAKIALISDGGLQSTLGSGAYVTGSSAAGVTPTFGITPVLSNGQLVFNAGVSSIDDRDANTEYAVIEYNALVENALPNQAGTRLTVGFAFAGTDTGSVDVTVVEPSVTDLLKSVSRSSAAPGDTVTYTLTFSNAATAAAAYNLAVLDAVPAGLRLNAGSVVVVGGTGVVDRTAGSTVSVGIDALAPGASVTITYTALVTAAAGVTLTNAAEVQYTSLPGTNGDDPNPTGSATPGGAGAAAGERTGGGAAGLNDYRGAATAALAVGGPPPAGTNSIAGKVFGDTNEDGFYDAGDALLAGVLINLYDAATSQVIATQRTDANGAYTFANLADGTYHVEQAEQPAGYSDGLDFVGTAGGQTGPNGGVGTDYIDDVAVAGGFNATGYDFGECPCDAGLADLSGYVYVDNNDNVAFDAGDVPIPGVTVTLTGTTNAGQAVTRTTQTDATGYYAFTGLPAGTYAVTETQPATFNGQPLLDGGDSPGSNGGTVGPNQGRGTDTISGIVLAAGDYAEQNNFGEIVPPVIPPGKGRLSGHVYYDSNDDGVFNASDRPIPGVTVNLLNAAGQVVGTTATDASGFYRFTNLDAGSYRVEEVQPTTFEGEAITDGIDRPGTGGGTVGPNGGRGTDFITGIAVVADGEAKDNDFYEIKPGINPGLVDLSGHVYFDANCNGVLEADDTPISGVTVRLRNAAGDLVSEAVTDANGFYLFSQLQPGRYTVEEVQPATNNAGAPVVDGIDRPGTTGGTVGPNDGRGTDFIRDITLTYANSENNDFYECPVPTPGVARLSGFVYVDESPAGRDNGIFDAGEAPIPGVTVTLRNAAGTAVATTTTNAQGFYEFTGLAPGSYTVVETQPANFLDGQDTPGSLGGDDSVNDQIRNIVLAAGDNSVNNNFGELTPPVVTPGTVSGYVFCYTGPAQNVRGPASTPIAGVTVTLVGTTAAGVAVTRVTTTDATGFYSFTNLAPGTYAVRETQPPVNALGTGLRVTDGDDSIEVVGGTNAVTPQNDVHPGITLTGTPAGGQTFYNFGEMCTGNVSGNSALDGFVYFDANRNAVYDRAAGGTPINGDLPIQGVTMTLTGTTAAGATVNRTAVTNEIGFYRFTDLDPGTYFVTQTQPNTFTANGRTVQLGDFAENPGTTGGTTGANSGIGTSNTLSNIPIAADFVESNQNNFGEVAVGNVGPNPGPNPLPNPINKGQLLSSTRPGGTGTNSVAGVSVIGTAAQAPAFTNAAGTLGNGNPNAVRYLVTGTDVGGGPIVRVFDFQTGVEKASFLAYDAAFQGGVRVASADVTGDGIADVITAAGLGGGPHIRVFDGVSFQLVREFMAYGADFRGGVYLAAADVTGDGVAEIITGAGEGGAGHVKVFNTVGQFAEFFAYDMAFRGGVRVAAADFNADGRADVVTGAGVGGGPHVMVFDLSKPVAGGFTLLSSVMAFDANFRGGVFVSANNNSGNGDANGDGRPDLVIGAGMGGQALVKVYSGIDFSQISSFLAYDTSFTGGARVGLLDSNGDGRADVIVGTGGGKGAFVRVVDLVSSKDLEFFQAYTPAYLGGVFVTGG